MTHTSFIHREDRAFLAAGVVLFYQERKTFTGAISHYSEDRLEKFNFIPGEYQDAIKEHNLYNSPSVVLKDILVDYLHMMILEQHDCYPREEPWLIKELCFVEFDKFATELIKSAQSEYSIELSSDPNIFRERAILEFNKTNTLCVIDIKKAP